MASIRELHEEVERLNREREETLTVQREKAVELARVRDAMYVEATAKRNAISEAGIYRGQVVQVFDPDKLDAETLEVLEHMGTPVLPIDAVFPEGVIIPGRGNN